MCAVFAVAAFVCCFGVRDVVLMVLLFVLLLFLFVCAGVLLCLLCLLCLSCSVLCYVGLRCSWCRCNVNVCRVALCVFCCCCVCVRVGAFVLCCVIMFFVLCGALRL